MNEEKISYNKLMAHINLNHPRDENGNEFSVFSDIGHLPLFSCCFEKQKNKSQEEIAIPKVV